MKLLRLWRNYTHCNGIEWCDIRLIFTVDGAVQFRDSLSFASDGTERENRAGIERLRRASRRRQP